MRCAALWVVTTDLRRQEANVERCTSSAKLGVKRARSGSVGGEVSDHWWSTAKITEMQMCLAVRGGQGGLGSVECGRGIRDYCIPLMQPPPESNLFDERDGQASAQDARALTLTPPEVSFQRQAESGRGDEGWRSAVAGRCSRDSIGWREHGLSSSNKKASSFFCPCQQGPWNQCFMSYNFILSS